MYLTSCMHNMHTPLFIIFQPTVKQMFKKTQASFWDIFCLYSLWTLGGHWLAFTSGLYIIFTSYCYIDRLTGHFWIWHFWIRHLSKSITSSLHLTLKKMERFPISINPNDCEEHVAQILAVIKPNWPKDQIKRKVNFIILWWLYKY